MAFGLGQGITGEQKDSYQGIYGNAGYASNLGQNLLNQGTDFMSSILSGDPTKVSQVLAPQITGIKDRAQQQKNQIAEFGNRSGGMNSAASGIDTDVNRQITDLVGTLTGNAATNLEGVGSNLLSQGSQGFDNSFLAASQMQKQNASKWNDIIGSIAGVGSGVLGALPGSQGGALDNLSNIFGSIG